MTKRAVVDHYTGPYTMGIDVSKWQGDIDWEKVADQYKGLKFAFVRISDGMTLDPAFDANWKALETSRLVRGFYSYFRADRGGRDQALLHLDKISQLGDWKELDLPPVLDLEDGARTNLPGGIYEGNSKLPVDQVAAEALEYLETIEDQIGCRPIIYTGQTFHWWFSQGRPDLAQKFAKYPLWTPSYTKSCRMPVDRDGKGFPWETYTFWQYKNDGKLRGIQGNVDMNFFRGNSFEFTKFIQDSWNNEVTVQSPVTVKEQLESLLKQAQLHQECIQKILDGLV